MLASTTISQEDLLNGLGLEKGPTILDVRIAEDFEADPRLLPGSRRRSHLTVADWAPALPAACSYVIVCQKGLKLSHGVAAWLRSLGFRAAALEGGALAWAEAALPMVPSGRLPFLVAGESSLWVTRERPKIDRIACPWLIRRFLDREARFLFVPESEVLAVAERFGGEPFDLDARGVFWTHRGEGCTFDTMLQELSLVTEPLTKLATIVRGADTARLDLAPECAGLLAMSLGLSKCFGEDQEQLAAGLLLYDALYRWCRDASGEGHNWPAKGGGN
ncbi:chromate resistance protein ChrB domain-containing protein [Limibacillus halophilus]